MRLDRCGSGARFACRRRYRYVLWRVWEPALGCCNFLMLNPSTADETTNDPTIERCQRRAVRLGYGGLVVTNLFALCTSDPAILRRAADPVGPENDAAIAAAAREARLVICAWGNHGAYAGRARAVRALLGELGVRPYCLGETRAGEPLHPLYLGYDRLPVAVGQPGVTFRSAKVREE
jgi:hypothetical protein